MNTQASLSVIAALALAAGASTDAAVTFNGTFASSGVSLRGVRTDIEEPPLDHMPALLESHGTDSEIIADQDAVGNAWAHALTAGAGSELSAAASAKADGAAAPEGASWAIGKHRATLTVNNRDEVPYILEVGWTCFLWANVQGDDPEHELGTTFTKARFLKGGAEFDQRSLSFAFPPGGEDVLSDQFSRFFAIAPGETLTFGTIAEVSGTASSTIPSPASIMTLAAVAAMRPRRR
jgi:hypothetical protein